ncbi:MAG: ABC transporter permease [Planctomycetes bacterium]|nr:ABC transporter permease [Planctomycetota bacterium]
MTTYILKRLLLMPFMLLGITLISFCIIVLAPGTSATNAGADMNAERLSQEQVQVLQQTFHVGEPLHLRYLYWVGLLQPQPYAIEWRDWCKSKARELADASDDPARHAELIAYIQALNAQQRSAKDFHDPGDALPEKWAALDREIRAQVHVPWRGVLFFDFGQSVATPSLSVSQRLLDALPITLLLNVICFFVIYTAAIPLGIVGAVKHNRLTDRCLTLALFVLYSLPSFWVALLLIKLMVDLPEDYRLPYVGMLSSGAEDLPTLAYLWEGTKHLILPVICLSYVSVASLSRYMRVGMLDVIRADFIRTARAKGCPENTVIYKHALRNSLIPIVTLIGGLLPSLIGGSLLIESIFSIPGMGLLSYQAVLTHDYTVLMANITIGAVLVMLGILTSDLLYLAVDPRIAFEKGA